MFIINNIFKQRMIDKNFKIRFKILHETINSTNFICSSSYYNFILDNSFYNRFLYYSFDKYPFNKVKVTIFVMLFNSLGVFYKHKRIKYFVKYYKNKIYDRKNM